jgi:hypothetical protein
MFTVTSRLRFGLPEYGNPDVLLKPEGPGFGHSESGNPDVYFKPEGPDLDFLFLVIQMFNSNVKIRVCTFWSCVHRLFK